MLVFIGWKSAVVETVEQYLEKSFKVNSFAPAQRFFADGLWRVRSYADVALLSTEAMEAMRVRGIGAGDRVALVLRTRADWTIIEIASAMLGAILTPFYSTSTSAQLSELIALVRPKVLIAESGSDLPSEAYSLPSGVISVGASDGDLGDLASPAGLGGEVSVAGRWSDASRHDVFTIAFSSGSTGRPKGCVILQRNYAAVLDMVLRAEKNPRTFHEHRKAAFIYLPLAHASARLQQLTSLCLGGEVIYGHGGTAEILAQIRETQPTYVAGVPRLFETAALIHAQSPQDLRDVFGPNLVYALSGGAPLSPEVLDIYERAGVVVVEGYGLTESSTAIAIGTPHNTRVGSVGQPLPGIGVKFDADQELLVCGENIFSGYMNDEAGTAEVLEDGWLRTGDFGLLDEDGFLFITGRKKNVIVTSTGKNISPEWFENAIRAATGITDFLLIGNGSPYVVGIAAPSQDASLDPSSLLAAARGINRQLSPQERVQKIAILTSPLDLNRGELTASGKVIRDAVERNQSDLIEQIYLGCGGASVLEVERHVPAIH